MGHPRQKSSCDLSAESACQAPKPHKPLKLLMIEMSVEFPQTTPIDVGGKTEDDAAFKGKIPATPYIQTLYSLTLSNVA